MSSGGAPGWAEATVEAPAAAPASADASSARAERPLPERLGRFVVQRQLGEGGMGVVLEARDPDLDRSVAIKLVRVTDERARARLVREAQAMARVTHAQVVPIYEVGVHDDEVFVVMEKVDGTTLADWLAAEPRPWRAVCALLVSAGRGLAAVHAAGLVHSDFKLENVLVGHDGRARVTDFGLARSVEASPPAIDEGAGTSAPGAASAALSAALSGLAGTPGYMAPEQFLGGAVTFASDQFALGVAAYRALYGRAPFPDESLEALVRAVVAGAVVPPPPEPEVPAAVRGAVLRALAPEPEHRWPSVAALVDALEAELTRDPGGDVERGRLTRGVLAVALVALSLNRFRATAAAGAENVTVEMLQGQLLLVTTVMLVCVAIFRRSLLATRYNQAIVGLFVFGPAGMTFHRFLAGAVGASPQATVLGDVALLAAVSSFGALVVDRRLAWCAGAAVLTGIVGTHSVAAALYSMPVMTGFAALFMLYLWRAPGERGRDRTLLSRLSTTPRRSDAAPRRLASRPSGPQNGRPPA